MPEYKRYFLPLLFLYFLPIFFSKLRTSEFITPVSVTNTFVVLYNFPILSLIFHSKPIYFEDLRDETLEDGLKDKFQKDFLIVISVALSFLSGVLANYFLFQIHTSSLKWFELIGVMGGVFSLYVKFQNGIGKILIYGMQWRKRRFSTPHPDLPQPYLDPPSLNL